MADAPDAPLRSRSGLDIGRLLAAAEAAAPVEAVDAVAATLRDLVGAQDVSFLIADFSGDSLIRLGHSGGTTGERRLRQETGDRVALTGTPHGRALASQTVQVAETAGEMRLYAPVTSRGEAVGVLELRLADEPDAETRDEVAEAAHALAYIVIANRRYTDLYEWGQRSVPLSLAAEIQHRLLPGSYTCEAAQFTLAGWLEPAGEVGGDTFDFSLDRDFLHFSISDAMGHTVPASLLATLMVGSVRNERRRGADLIEQARGANAALIEHAGGSQYVTGQIGCVDLATGTAKIVNAGHPPPLRLRHGVVDEVVLATAPPFGVVEDPAHVAEPLTLEPGDRFMFLTDGLLERGAAAADLREILRSTHGRHPREAVQHLVRAAAEASNGKLQDDGTALCLDWHGGAPGPREAFAGARPGRRGLLGTGTPTHVSPQGRRPDARQSPPDGT